MTLAKLSAFGALFSRHAEALVGSEENPADPGYVARLCYLAGFVYLGFVVFCGLQVRVSFSARWRPLS